MFEKASRLKLRFKTTQGLITVEDLWDLSLSSLDMLAKEYRRQLREQEDESFVKRTRKNAVLELRFELVKYIIEIKLSEADAAEKRVAKRQQKEKLMGILAEKEEADLRSKDPEEIRKMLDELSEV